MSGKLMGQVWDLQLDHAECLVLLALADHADHEGNNIHPSIGLIAWKTGYSDRQVQRVIAKLCKARILTLIKAASGRPKTYRIDLSRGRLKPVRQHSDGETDPRQNVTPDKMSPLTRQNVTPTGDKMSGGGDIAMSGGGDIAMSPKPSITVMNQPSSSPQPADDDDDDSQKQPKNDPMLRMLYQKRIGAARQIAALYRESYPDLDAATVEQSIDNLFDPQNPGSLGLISRRLRDDPPAPGQPWPPPARAVPKGGSGIPQATKPNIAPDAISMAERARRNGGVR